MDPFERHRLQVEARKKLKRIPLLDKTNIHKHAHKNLYRNIPKNRKNPDPNAPKSSLSMKHIMQVMKNPIPNQIASGINARYKRVLSEFPSHLVSLQKSGLLAEYQVSSTILEYMRWFKNHKFNYVIPSDKTLKTQVEQGKQIGEHGTGSVPSIVSGMRQKYMRPELIGTPNPTHKLRLIDRVGKFMYSAQVELLVEPPNNESRLEKVLLSAVDTGFNMVPGSLLILKANNSYLHGSIRFYLHWHVYSDKPVVNLRK